jgi:hypothetical protein
VTARDAVPESSRSHESVSTTPAPPARAKLTVSAPPTDVEVVPVRGLAQRQALARSRAEAHEHYLNARDGWVRTMKLAASGRPADLAALAIAQEAYEEATAEWERWESGTRVAVPIETEKDASVGAVVDQELRWRKLHDHDHPPGLGARIARITQKLRGR